MKDTKILILDVMGFDFQLQRRRRASRAQKLKVGHIPKAKSRHFHIA